MTTTLHTRLAPGATMAIRDNHVRVDFPSMHALVQQARMLGPNVTNSRSDRATDTWDLRAGFDGALALAHHWPQGVEQIADAMWNAPRDDASPVPSFSHVGYRPHVPTFLTGNPRCYVRQDEQPRQGVSLLASMACHCAQSAKRILNRGAAIAGTVRDLSDTGTPVELVVGFDLKDHAHFSGRVVVKHMDEDVNPHVLAFALLHPAMLRRLVFSVMEQFHGPVWSHMIRTGYGYPLSSVPDRARDVVCLPHLDDSPTWNSAESSRRAVLAALPKLEMVA